jgi:Domain of unknown function (DUF3291)
MHMALWWIPIGLVPSVSEAEQGVAHQQEHGPTPYAFTFKVRFLAGAEAIVDEELGCPA